MPSLAIAAPPPLRDGDRLDSREFLRRREAMPDLLHAELIDGVVCCLPSPVSTDHSDAHSRLAGWLSGYAEYTPGTAAGAEGTWVMGSQSVQQPDVALRILPEYGGQSRMSGKYAAGSPELVVEVSRSSATFGGDPWSVAGRSGDLDWKKPLRVALDAGLQSPEHAAFLKRRASARRRGK